MSISTLMSVALFAAAKTGLPDDRNGIFSFCSWSLITITAVTIIWPLNVPLAALAFKVLNGYKPVPMESESFWWRSAFAALGLFGITLVMLGLAYLLIAGMGFPAGLTHLMLLLAYIPAGVWFMFWIFALEDMFQAVNVFFIYILLPGFPILLIGWIAGWWSKLGHSLPWLVHI